MTRLFKNITWDKSKFQTITSVIIGVFTLVYTMYMTMHLFGHPGRTLVTWLCLSCLITVLQLRYLRENWWSLSAASFTVGFIIYWTSESIVDYSPMLTWLSFCLMNAIWIPVLFIPIFLKQRIADKHAIRDSIRAYLAAVRDRDTAAIQTWLIPASELDIERHPHTVDLNAWPEARFSKETRIKSTYTFPPIQGFYVGDTWYQDRVTTEWRFIYEDYEIPVQFVLYQQDDIWRIANVNIVD